MVQEEFALANGVLMVLGGLVLLLAGAKLARALLFLVGFALGAAVAAVPAAIFLGGWAFVAAIVVIGILGGVVGLLLYNAAPIVVGAAGGWMLGLALAAALPLPGAAWFWALGLSVAGILVALWIRDYVVAAGSALVGAWLLVNGVAYLVEGSGNEATAWGESVLDGRVQLVAILVLALAGGFLQARAIRRG